MAEKTIRLVLIDSEGEIKITDYTSCEPLLTKYEQVGIDDCSTDLSLRGFPVFRGLVGPIPESKQVCRYESPEVFEQLTKEWSFAKSKRRSRAAAPIPVPNLLTSHRVQTESVVENR